MWPADIFTAPGTSTASCIGPLFYPVFLLGHQSTFCINFRTNKTTPISSYPAAGSCLGEVGSSGTWLCKNIHLPCKSFMQQGRYSKPTSCLNSKVYEVDVYKCLVGWFISLRFDPNVNEITFRSPSGKKWSIEGALEPPLAHLSGQHTQHNTQRRNWAENQSFSFFCFTINTISSAWSGL